MCVKGDEKREKSSKIVLLAVVLSLVLLSVATQMVSAYPSKSPDGIKCTPCHKDGRTGAKSTTVIKTTTKKATTTAKAAPAKTNVNSNLVKLRDLAKTYGATFNWNRKTRTVTIVLNGRTVLFPVGKSIAVVDGKEIALSATTKLVGQRAMAAKDVGPQILRVMAAGYVGSEVCGKCHAEKYNNFIVSGHPWKLQPAAKAMMRPLPLPKGATWNDISYVIGGYKWKSRYMDKNGYIITTTGDGPGKNQYNLATGTWSDYEAGQRLKYDCGKCHTTGYSQEGHQDGLPGVVGTWAEPGIGCEACHGPGAAHVKTNGKSKVKIDKSAALCGKCHIRGSADTIPASKGFIQHHEQYNELMASPHKAINCVTCHDPHKKAEFSIKSQGNCASCHSSQADSYAATQMAKVGVTCTDCHMPMATKSAVAASPVKGDVMTHLFKIETSPTVSMFSEDGKNAKGFVTLDFACLSCHKDKDINWAAEKAANVH